MLLCRGAAYLILKPFEFTTLATITTSFRICQDSALKTYISSCFGKTSYSSAILYKMGSSGFSVDINCSQKAISPLIDRHFMVFTQL